MNTFQLSCFLAVAETLSFARASEQLNITQPAVTHQIRSLESELNARLFHRTTRSVEITPAGQLFLDDAREILSLSARARHRFENPSGQEILPFSIGCHNYAQIFLLSDILHRLSELYPQIHPDLRAVPYQHLFRLLEEETVDVVIGFKESDSHKVPGIYRELLQVPVTCICSRDNPLASRETVTIEELEQQRLVATPPTKTPSVVARIHGRLLGNKPLCDVYFCESAEASIVLVQAGLGITVLPDLAIPPDSSLVRIPVAETEALSFGVYYKTLKGNKPLKSFIQLMTDSLSL